MKFLEEKNIKLSPQLLEEVNKVVLNEIQNDMNINLENANESDRFEEETLKQTSLFNIKYYPKKSISSIENFPYYEINKFFPDANKAFESYLSAYSESNFFSYAYNKINNIFPNILKITYFDSSRFVNNILKYLKPPIYSYNKSISYENYTAHSKPIITSMLSIAFSKKLLYVEDGHGCIIYYDPKEEKDPNSDFYKLMCIIRKYFLKTTVEKNKIYIVYQTNGGFDKIRFDIKKVKIDIDKNYNDDFKEFSEKIISGLNNKNKTSLVILSGEPGVGKCVIGKTKIIVRNKKTGISEEINIEDLMDI